jgi:hypothetical protein
MYQNLIKVMKVKNVTYSQIAELLKCQLRTVSDKANGNVESGFSIDEAILIKKVLFPEYDIVFLIERQGKVA